MNDFKINIKHAVDSFELKIDCQIPSNGLTVVFGPSGCGKSTLLRCLAGLIRPKQAEVVFKNIEWQTEQSFVKAQQRRVAVVFQDDNLLPHLNVADNINYAIKRRQVAGQSLKEVIVLFDLENLVERRPDSLSGGERQRVAMARALASAPDLLLMDEPMSALDDDRKTQLLAYLKKLKQQVPIIYITHSRQEMMRLADHVLMMEQGRVVASGGFWKMMQTQDQLMTGEQTIWSVLNGQVILKDKQHHLCQLEVGCGQMWVNATAAEVGENVRLLLNASDVAISMSEPTDSSVLNVVSGKIESIKPFNASQSQVALEVDTELGSSIISALLTHKSIEHLELQTGQQVFAQVKAVALLL